MRKLQKKLVIIGNGMVGHHLVKTLIEYGSVWDVTVLGKEPHAAYDRVHLSEMFAGRDADSLSMVEPGEYEAAGVDARFGVSVVAINRQAKRVELDNGQQIQYDKLVLATGSYPFVPPIPGSEDARCLVYRTLEDLAQIQAKAQGAKRGVVIGGGLLGLECASALKNLGLETHVVEFAPGLMGVQLDEQGSTTLRQQIESLGVSVHTSKATQSINGSSKELTLEFADGESLSTDLLVFSAGIRPYDELGKSAGLEAGERGGIVVDGQCRTSDESIYAVGECALYDGRIFGLVAPGYRMAEVVADNLRGEGATFNGADMSTKLKMLGVDVGSIGDAHGHGENVLAYTYIDPVKKEYRRLNVSSDGQRVVGAVLVGDCGSYDSLLQYYLNDLPLPEDPASLILPTSEALVLDSSALPDSAIVCSCHNVSKGTLCGLVNEGCHDLGVLKATTKASSGCGGCATAVKSLFEAELEGLGLEVDKSLCEHFPYTRQELFHLCQIEHIKDMRALLEKHGSGLGCDICKPAAASIFASLFNEHVLEDAHLGLQDTNDRMLANMQKDGSYSVVPRIPGGEITPKKLIAIGEVAQRYDLYTKITGGQRIDLFGAQVHELPLIWSELIAAGFETGHAYGKALRTVKSCVGTSWCRYGVQDSVSMALLVENRYKGLRSPHKLKMAVSGCTRECAEAQSKDIGVIAVEGGWNLFVGGNGGMRPRHADLFATEIDDATLLKYIDRILMFYVRTADKLQRTSVWLENLEGGLEYLRQVVIDDSLEIGAELERQMANVIDTYQCEWKAVVTDDAKLKRFKSFVNSESEDSQVVYVRERSQKRPATEAEKLMIVEAS